MKKQRDHSEMIVYRKEKNDDEKGAIHNTNTEKQLEEFMIQLKNW